MIGPLLGRGYLLLRDAVSTPRSYLSDTALGLMAAPRATPQDFAVAVASHLIDGGIAVKLLLVAGLWLAGWGAAHLVATLLPESGTSGQFVAITLAIWNPYVAERLLQGHWSLLLGYGCLPWLATTMLALRCSDTETGPRWPQLGRLAFWFALAGLTPTGLLLAATVALACVAAPGRGVPRWRCGAVAAATATLAALPWLTASIFGPPLTNQGGALGAAAFAARAEPGLSTLGSLASLGGIWNGAAVPASRASLFAVISALVLLGIVALGLPALLRRPAATPLLVLAAAAVLIPAALASSWGVGGLGAAVDAWPGLAVLRDGQKWVALAMPAYALAGAGSVLALQRWLRPAVTASVCCSALILALPDLAWGVCGQVKPVQYPAGWAATAAEINNQPGAVAVLPAGMMRRFRWSGPVPVLDPLPRWVRADVLTTGDLTISGRTLPGEGTQARAVQQLLLAGAEPAAIARAGVSWLVVERDTPGDLGAAAQTLAALPLVYRDDSLALYLVGGSTASASPAQRRAILLAHAVWLTLLGAPMLGLGAWLRIRRRR